MAGNTSSKDAEELFKTYEENSPVRSPLHSSRNGSAVLVVDDDPEVCTSLCKAVSHWGMNAEAVTNPLEVRKRFEHGSYDLVLLDVVMPLKSGIELIPEIVDSSPDTRIIMMTAYADKSTALKALRSGAFDLLEKPFHLGILFHTINRALAAQRAELENRKMVEELLTKKEELLSHKRRLEYLNEKLMETNKALTILAQNIENARRDTEKQIITKLRSLVMPIIEKLQKREKRSELEGDLNMLRIHVEDLTNGLATETRISTSLSAAELRIASLIKNGLSSEEIAGYISISLNTVKTHRRNIRKKLNINNTHQALRHYLCDKLEEHRRSPPS